MKQLRIYTLKDKNTAETYFHHHWPKHLISLPKFGIFINNVYLGTDDQASQVIAIVTLPDGCDPHALNQEYMRSEEFKADMEGFDISGIIRVEEISLETTLF
ncbi:hypothetical protein CWC46_20390 [Prodigiosinella confusarubida]|uniref:NIPSNAP domain-containing protein n=1 Tax=Serratia sp. (strain ATCC 39006) TaxID=104623 RepID=A0A2I5TNW9_SERS3|nr:hypothetical protein [Serratia sp. ATCC 39006]AUH01941.1 hypothetical protein CWC46_20390 [Serratia sp. ATCC 39006]AUH06263.1 hypothetical protein Ser39006_020385 [Serratia sp. ATCC 39006]